MNTKTQNTTEGQNSRFHETSPKGGNPAVESASNTSWTGPFEVVHLHPETAVWFPAEDPNLSVSVSPENGTNFTLKELQTAVGGRIDIVSLPHWLLIVNDEGALNGSPMNLIATCLAGQPIFGDVLLSPIPWVR